MNLSLPSSAPSYKFHYLTYFAVSILASLVLFWIDHETESWAQILEQGNWIAMSIYAFFLWAAQMTLHSFLKSTLNGPLLGFASITSGFIAGLGVALFFFLTIQALQ